MTALFKYGLHFLILICDTPTAEANPISTRWKQQLHFKSVFLKSIVHVRVPQNQYCQSSLCPRDTFTVKIIHCWPRRRNIIHKPEDTRDARGVERRGLIQSESLGKDERARNIYTLLAALNGDHFSWRWQPRVQPSTLFLEIKLIRGEMIKNVENGCQRGES